jgi:hypothetical protein
VSRQARPAVSLGSRQRAELLDMAQELTSFRDDQAAVAINASVPLARAEAAWDTTDFEARMRAVQQRDSARRSMRRWRRSLRGPCMDNPAEFVRQAQVLYAFAIADASDAGQPARAVR